MPVCNTNIRLGGLRQHTTGILMATLEGNNTAVYAAQFVYNSNNVAPLPPPPANKTRRDNCDKSLKFFLETHFKSTFPLDWSPEHLKIIEEIEQRVIKGGLKAIGMPRGSGKTSLILRAALWAILSGHRKFVCIVAANEYAATSNLATIKTEINHNESLTEDYALELRCLQHLGGEPRRVPGQHFDNESTGVEYSIRRLDFGTIPGSAASGAIISAVGITGQIRGQQKATIAGKTVRPDLVLVDDPQTKASAASPSQVVKRHQIMMGDILGLAGPGIKVAGFATCTVIYKHDLADRLLNKSISPDWSGSKVSMIQSWPKWFDGWSMYNDIRVDELSQDKSHKDSLKFVKDNYDRLHEGGKVYWEARKSPNDLSALHHAMDLYFRDQDVFSAEFQNSPESVMAVAPYILNPDKIARRTTGLPRAIVPNETKAITAFIDVQKDLLYYVIVAWSQQGRGFVIDYGACPDQSRSHWSKSSVANTLVGTFGGDLESYLRGGLNTLTRAILENDYQSEDGAVHQIAKLAIDCRWGESTTIVRRFVRESPHRARIVPSMGLFVGANTKEWQKIKLDRKDKKGVNCKLVTPKESGSKELVYDTNFWKSYIADRLMCDQEATKAIVLFDAPVHVHRMFAEHMAYEDCVSVTGKSGTTVTEWRQTRTGGTVENDYFDCLVGNAALASIMGISTHDGGKTISPVSAKILEVMKQKTNAKFKEGRK